MSSFTSFGGNGSFTNRRAARFKGTLSKVMGRHSELGAELRHYSIDNIQRRTPLVHLQRLAHRACM
jgi:hypothetical protein